MANISLNKAEARAIIIHAAGLSKPAQFGKGIEAAYKVIHHLGFVQVDTNYVVERAHHHAIAARVPGYQTAWLQELQADARIYEFWTRDAGFMPMDEFRYSLPVHQLYTEKWHSLPLAERNIMDKVLDRIGREGPLAASDFENDRTVKSNGWWDWRPSKVALERLHLGGQLLTTRKSDFHKLYDLTRNIVPADIDKTMPSVEEISRHMITRSLQALGIAYIKEIAWNARRVKHCIKEEIKRMVAEGTVVEVSVEGLKGPLFMLPQYKKRKIKLSGDMFILSPFDMLNVFRHRLRDFFEFDYQVECFVPAAKRKYGYFSLPILSGDVFVARMDAKAERKSNTLVINNIHFEKLAMSAQQQEQLFEAIRSFAAFNKCSHISVTKSNKKSMLTALRKQCK
ncbi:MAG TPA: crosslink repair DNA glycosylase YcaQ family protein [Chitinophagaceae bacterium]|nr:crosslink repair DNA glycosylase YcaQ family protein [Chitinophagaceae bacterium]